MTDSPTFPVIGTLPTSARADKNARRENKPRLDLVDPRFLTALARVLTHGAEKYAPHNWRKGLLYSEVYAAALRHLNAWNAGDDHDAESGLPHLAHAACNLMFLVAYSENQRHELDDRPTSLREGTSA